MNGNKTHPPTKRKRNSLPPHTWEAHPSSKTAEINKTFIIAIISLVAVVVLALLLFVTSQFVGKATYIAPGAAGHTIEVTITSDDTMQVTVRLRNSKTANGVYVELTSVTAGYNLCDGFDTDEVLNNLWDEFYDVSCANGIFRFSDATLSDELYGDEFLAVEFPLLTLPSSAALNLRLNAIDVYDSSTGIDLFPAANILLEVAVPPPPEVSVCGPDRLACPVNQQCVNGACVATTQMTLTSLDFNNGEVLREEFTCGMNRNIIGVSPPLTIRNIPTGTRSLALLVEDLDIERTPSIPLVHWAVYNIPITTGTRSLDIPRAVTFSATVPVTAPVLRGNPSLNEITRTTQYAAPCPPAGTTHRYRFKVYALTTPTINPAILTDTYIRSNEFADTIPQASLTGLYYPPPVHSPAPSGGRSRCYSEWSCQSTWSYCNSNLEQSRSCTDLNRCVRTKLTKLEVRSCTACEESWICTPWPDCQQGQQSRSCVDEHSCRTTLQKPVLQKSCAVAETGPAPVRVQPQLPPPQVQQPTVPVPSFWDTYFWPIAGAALALLTVVLIIFGLVYAFRPKAVKPAAYNTEELKEWVQKEQQMGTSNEDIKTILAQHTGWGKEEIEKVLGKPV